MLVCKQHAIKITYYYATDKNKIACPSVVLKFIHLMISKLMDVLQFIFVQQTFMDIQEHTGE